MVEEKDVKSSDSRTKELKYKSRINSIKAGMFASAKSSFGDYYLSPFAIAINASNALVALLTSVSGILGPLSQMFGSRLIEKSARKKIVLRAVLFELLFWIPFVTIAVLYWTSIIQSALPIIFLFFFAFYVIFSNLGTPAWFSWTGDIVDERYRGRWFSKRNLLTGFVSVVLALASSFILDYFKKIDLIMGGFIVLFLLALISRVISWKFYHKQYEPKLEFQKGDYFSFSDFLIRARKTNFGRFSFFNAALNFAASISSPLFVIYMLRDLNFSYLTYMLITVAGIVFSLLVMEIWGRIADRYGNYAVLYISGFLISIVPVLWIFSPSPVYLILVPTLISGISSAGFNLASNNFVYDNVRPDKRGLAISYFNMLTGIGIFLGASFGAFLIKFLSISFISPILAIFILSGGLMIITTIVFMPMIREVRDFKRRRGGIKNLIIRQFKPAFIGEVHEILSINKYLKR
ncbi:MAG: MFS transporter [Candidatus Pacearchaeota archaeon]|nr:MFS transporter [Candidatus Pacearchaeota archaeon]